MLVAVASVVVDSVVVDSVVVDSVVVGPVAVAPVVVGPVAVAPVVVASFEVTSFEVHTRDDTVILAAALALSHTSLKVSTELSVVDPMANDVGALGGEPVILAEAFAHISRKVSPELSDPMADDVGALGGEPVILAEALSHISRKVSPELSVAAPLAGGECVSVAAPPAEIERGKRVVDARLMVKRFAVSTFFLASAATLVSQSSSSVSPVFSPARAFSRF